MKIKYFSDTDTALVEFSDLEVAETKEINENIYIDLDTSGNLVAMTIEHDVGVSTVSMSPVKKIDTDYFDEGI